MAVVSEGFSSCRQVSRVGRGASGHCALLNSVQSWDWDIGSPGIATGSGYPGGCSTLWSGGVK